MKTIINFALGLSVLSISVLASAETQQPTSQQALPEVACRYEMTTVAPSKTNTSVKKAWYFWRKPSMIQTLEADGHYGEIWELTATGHIHYRKLYPADKTAVEYMPADNTVQDMAFDWTKLSMMLNPKELAGLKTIKKTKILGKAAEVRTGVIDGKQVKVLWLVEEQLPAEIISHDKHKPATLRLISLEPFAKAHHKPFAVEELAAYRHIDAVDFGDMESDPFVRKILASTGHSHHH